MAQIHSGLASVSNGSAIVTGSSTIWQNNVSPGDAFTVAGTNVIYDVASVQSNTQLTLSAPYSGASATDVTYAITRDFTSPDNFPELVVGDIETPTILTRSIRKIQQRFNQASDYTDQSIVDHEALPDPHPQYLEDTRYEQDRLRESLLAEATLNLDFANNKYEVYEGPVDSLTAKPFNDIVTFTRASGASARNAIGGLSPVLTDQQRLVGNREGLLIEEQRTNLLLWSEAFDNAVWSKARITVNANAGAAPDSTLTADKLTEDTSSDTTHVAFQNIGSLTADTLYTGTFFVKPAGRSHLAIGAVSGSEVVGEPLFAFFDLGAESVNNVNPNASAKIVSLSNGWFKCSANFETSGTGTRLSVYLAEGADFISSVSNSTKYTGDGTSGIYIWGANCKTGEYTDSYIKTEGSQVTRVSDYAKSITGTNVLTDEQFTIFGDGELITDSRIGAVLTIGALVSSNRLYARYRGRGVFELAVIASGVTVVNTSSPDTGLRAGAKVKMAISKYKNGNLHLYVNGSLIASSTITVSINTSKFSNSASVESFGGSPAIWRKNTIFPRALTSSELEALTS